MKHVSLSPLSLVPGFLSAILLPNPASEFLALSLPPGSAIPDQVDILDVQGRAVVRLDRATVWRMASTEADIDLSSHLAALSSGTYWVRATRGGMESAQSIRIVK